MYDFSSLSSYDFELISADLLGRHLDVRFEVFAPGPDGGVDLRHLSTPDGPMIVQCKHWLKSGWSKLIAHLEGVELDKVRALNPERYLLATSVPMTPDRKKVIHSLLSPFMESPDDVYGAEDLNGLLRAHPEIEQRHFKLWLSSTHVLQLVLHGGIHAASQYALADIERRVALYVPGDAYDAGLSVLNQHHSCIIAGLPGVGKTMLANMLMYSLVGAGYTPYVLRQDIAEADDVYRSDIPQVFLYDDFLGQTASAEKLSKNEDARLAAFLDRVGRADNKRLILTTREYILQQGKKLYARINDPEFEVNKYVLSLSNYSRFDKAQILYNHLFFSDLPREVQVQILDKAAYLAVIDHRNYNPRLIEYVVKLAATERPGETLPDFFLSTLDKPETLWRHAVASQLGEVERVILIVLCTLPAESRLTELFECASAYANFLGLAVGNRSMHDALRILEDTFVRVSRVRSGPTIEFHNPSIRDFQLGEFNANPRLVAELVGSSTMFEQVELIYRYGAGVSSISRGIAAYPEIRIWFEENAEMAVSKLTSLFESSVARYIRVVDPGGVADLVPERSSEARLASVTEIAMKHDVDLSDWLPNALGVLQAGWVLGVGDREDWAQLLRAVEDGPYADFFLDVAEDAYDWFFGDMNSAEAFFAYKDIKENSSWWLPTEHDERIRELFGWFAETQLEWITYDVDDPDLGNTALEDVQSPADDFGVQLDDSHIRGAQESLSRFGDPDDYYTPSRTGSHSTASSSGDIESLFQSL